MGVCVGLMSGGIDSPVAAARAMRVGWDLHPLHFSMEPITGPEARERTVAGLKHLKGHGRAFGKGDEHTHRLKVGRGSGR